MGMAVFAYVLRAGVPMNLKSLSDPKVELTFTLVGDTVVSAK